MGEPTPGGTGPGAEPTMTVQRLPTPNPDLACTLAQDVVLHNRATQPPLREMALVMVSTPVANRRRSTAQSKWDGSIRAPTQDPTTVPIEITSLKLAAIEGRVSELEADH
jgi:hypothetical protein